MLKDVSNQKFGKLTVISYDKSKKQWLCQCECGEWTYANTNQLTSGRKKSCGCLLKGKFAEYEHDRTFKKLYKVWGKMKERCYNKNNVSYCRYGGKGIKVCNEWEHDFIAFYKWAIENGYKVIDEELKNKMSLDRIDSSKDYCPENCRWISYSENCSRKSWVNERLEELDDETVDDMVQDFIERKIALAEYEKEHKKEISQLKKRQFFYRKPNYCHLTNNDGSKQYLFRNYKTIALFLEISPCAVSYRVRKKDGVLNEIWKVKKISKEEFLDINRKGVILVR